MMDRLTPTERNAYESGDWLGDPVFDCDGCGTILDPGVDHDCPVLGTIVRLEEVIDTD